MCYVLALRPWPGWWHICKLQSSSRYKAIALRLAGVFYLFILCLITKFRYSFRAQEFPNHLIVMRSDWGHNSRSAVNQHFNKWYKMLAMAESEKLHKQGPIHWLSPISSSSGYLGHYHPSACFVVSVLFLGRYWWYPEVVCVSCSNIIISNIPGIIRATQNIVRNFPPSAATLLSPHVCFLQHFCLFANSLLGKLRNKSN